MKRNNRNFIWAHICFFTFFMHDESPYKFHYTVTISKLSVFNLWLLQVCIIQRDIAADHLHQGKERNFVYLSSSSKFLFSFSVIIDTFCSGFVCKNIDRQQQFNLLLNFIDCVPYELDLACIWSWYIMLCGMIYEFLWCFTSIVYWLVICLHQNLTSSTFFYKDLFFSLYYVLTGVGLQEHWVDDIFKVA